MNILKTGAAAVLAALIVHAGGVNAAEFTKLSSTNPNPPIDHGSLLAKPPILFAQAKPRQVAQQSENPPKHNNPTSSNQQVRPPSSNQQVRPPSPDAQFIHRLNTESIENQQRSADNLRKRPPIPGGE